MEGVDISVNGEVYKIGKLPIYGGELGVKVPKADSYLVTYPVGKVSDGGHIAKVTTTVSEDQTTEQGMYYYGALAGQNGIPIRNPGTVRMQPCLAVINPRFNFDSIPSDVGVQVSDVKISPVATNENLAGTASFVVNEQDKYLFPDLNPNIVFESSKQSIKLGLNDDESAYCVTFPQTLNEGLRISFNCTLTFSGSVVVNSFSKAIPATDRLQAGYLYSINIQVGVKTVVISTSVSDYTSDYSGITVN